MIKQFASNYFKTLSALPQFEFATKMSASSTQKTKDSAGRRLGVKKFGSEEVFPNDILIRQRGFKWKPGKNTSVGRDHTIHAKCEVIHTNQVGCCVFRERPTQIQEIILCECDSSGESEQD